MRNRAGVGSAGAWWALFGTITVLSLSAFVFTGVVRDRGVGSQVLEAVAYGLFFSVPLLVVSFLAWLALRRVAAGRLRIWHEVFLHVLVAGGCFGLFVLSSR